MEKISGRMHPLIFLYKTLGTLINEETLIGEISEG
jgi:hypothetical protein